MKKHGEGKARIKKNVSEIVPDDIEDLRHEELSGDDSDEKDFDLSQTDEDENEGLGDGNIGRSSPDPLSK